MYSVENLHAKVFVFDDVVIVGSSNVSSHSKLGLAEAGIETTNAALRSQVIAWIESLALAPVTPKLAAAKAKLYSPPKWGTPTGTKSAQRKTQKKRSRSPVVGRLWVINSWPAAFTDQEDEILERQAASAKSLLQNKKKYEVDTIRFPGAARFAREARLGDLAIVIDNDGKTTDVYPPARVVYTKLYRVAGVARIGVHLERHTDDSPHPWGVFSRAARAAGLKVSKWSNREIRDAFLHETLLRFFVRKGTRS